jgi:uncharacterized RDD family membrane protein YckC
MVDFNLVRPPSESVPSDPGKPKPEPGIPSPFLPKKPAPGEIVKTPQITPAKRTTEPGDALWDRELVRPGQEENVPPTLAKNAPPAEYHPLVERTLEKLKRAQVGTVPPAISTPPPAAMLPPPPAPPPPTPRKTRRAPTDSNRVERIEINLNQPMLPFDATAPSISPSPNPQVSRGLTAAPISPRFISGVIDLSFLTGSFLIFLLIVRFIPDFSFSSRSALLGLGMVFVLLGLGYLFLFTAFIGKTLGMDQQNLRVVDFHGRFPNPRQSILRACGYLISTGCFGLGFLWAVFDAEKLSWQDRISGTLIVPQLTSDFF